MSNRVQKPHLSAIRWAITNWSVVFSGLFVYSGLSALTLIVLARNVAPVEYGRYLASYALASFAVIIPKFGIDAWLLTQPKESGRSATALWMSTIRAATLTLGIWLIAMLPLAALLPAETYPSQVLIPTMVGVALDSLIQISFAALRSQGRHSNVAILQSLASGALFGLAIILPLEQSGVALFAMARMLLSLFFAMLVIGLLGNEYRRQPGSLTPIRQVLAASRPFFWANLSSSVYVKADLTIVSLAIGAVGTTVYGPAINLLQASFLPSLAIFFFVVPVLSKAYNGQWVSVSRSGRAQMAAQGLLGITIAAVLFVFADAIIDLIFGPGYQASGAVVRLLSPVVLFRALNMGVAAIIMACGYQAQRSKVQVAVALFNVIGNLIIVGIYGLVGVSVIYILSELALLSGQLFLLHLVRTRSIRISS